MKIKSLNIPRKSPEQGTSGGTKHLLIIMGTSLFMALISAVWGLGQTLIYTKIEENQKLFISHVTNDDRHIKWEKQIDHFILRQEYERDIEEIKQELKAIRETLERLR